MKKLKRKQKFHINTVNKKRPLLSYLAWENAGASLCILWGRMEHIYMNRQTATVPSQFIYFGLARHIDCYEKNMSVLAKMGTF